MIKEETAEHAAPEACPPRKGCFGKYWKVALAIYVVSYAFLCWRGGYIEVSNYNGTLAVYREAKCWTLHDGHFHGSENWWPSLVGLVYLPLIIFDTIFIHPTEMVYSMKNDGIWFHKIVDGRLVDVDEKGNPLGGKDQRTP